MDYDRRVRPVLHPDTVLNVSMKIHVNNVIDLNAKSQVLMLKLWIAMSWYDEFLKFNSSYYGQEYLAGSSYDIWIPDVVLYESLDEERPGMIDHPIFLLNSSGRISWIPVMITKSACKFNVTDYPFDQQICPLTFGTWVHSNNDVHLKWNNTLYDNRVFVTSGEWDVKPLQCFVEETEYSDKMFDILRCHLKLTRRPLHYIFNLVVPCILLLLVGTFTFLLPVSSGEKVTLSITILLALTVFVLVLMENLPPNSDAIPLLGKFIVACIILLAISTVMAVSVVNMVARGNEETGSSLPPPWLKNMVLHGLAKFVCFSVKKKTANITNRPHETQNRSQSSCFHDDHHIQNQHYQKETQHHQDHSHNTEKTSLQLWIEIATVIDRLYLLVYFVVVIMITITVLVFSIKSI